MARCPTVDLELVQTTRNVNGTRHSVRKFQPGKRAHLFRFSTFSGNFQWDEPTKRVPFTAEPEIPEILTKWKAPLMFEEEPIGRFGFDSYKFTDGRKERDRE